MQTGTTSAFSVPKSLLFCRRNKRQCNFVFVVLVATTKEQLMMLARGTSRARSINDDWLRKVSMFIDVV